MRQETHERGVSDTTILFDEGKIHLDSFTLLPRVVLAVCHLVSQEGTEFVPPSKVRCGHKQERTERADECGHRGIVQEVPHSVWRLTLT